jgi:hypothetical protein
MNFPIALRYKNLGNNTLTEKKAGRAVKPVTTSVAKNCGKNGVSKSYTRYKRKRERITNKSRRFPNPDIIFFLFISDTILNYCNLQLFPGVCLLAHQVFGAGRPSISACCVISTQDQIKSK